MSGLIGGAYTIIKAAHEKDRSARSRSGRSFWQSERKTIIFLLFKKSNSLLITVVVVLGAEIVRRIVRL